LFFPVLSLWTHFYPTLQGAKRTMRMVCPRPPKHYATPRRGPIWRIA